MCKSWSAFASLIFQLKTLSTASTRNLHFTVGSNTAKANSDAISNSYQVIDHEYDAVVVGAGKWKVKSLQTFMILGSTFLFRWRRFACCFRSRRRRFQDSRHHKALPHPIPHSRCPRWNQRRPRQHGKWRLEMAHVWHSEGIRLARRPGRNSLHDSWGAKGCHRVRELRNAVFTYTRWQNLPARVRRSELQFWKGWTGASLLLRRWQVRLSKLSFFLKFSIKIGENIEKTR